MKAKRFSALLAAPVLFVSMSAFAQDAAVTKYVPDTKEVAAGAAPESMETIDARRGLDGVLSISANVNLVQNSAVVGQVDGFSTVFGLGLTGGLDWIHGRHEIRNTLVIDESFSRTPVLSKFVKNSDLLNFSSQYNYFFLDWMGAFGRLSFETSLFPNYDYRSKQVDYEVTDANGQLKSKTRGDEMKISGAFSPISLSQSLGIIADPLRTEPLSLTTRLGVGGRESFAEGVLFVTDSNDTTVKLKELQNVYQFGVEAFVGGNGKFYDGRLSYDFGVSVLFPFANNYKGDKNAFQLTRVGVGGSVNFAVFSWMGLTYKLFMLRDPQMVEDIQLQNSLLITFNYTFIERNKKRTAPPLPPSVEEVQKEKEAAEARAAEAEQKLKEAEARAAEAEAKAKAANAQVAEEKQAASTAEKAADAPATQQPANAPANANGAQ